MVACAALSQRKLSTTRYKGAQTADNRIMNHMSTRDGLARFLTIADIADVLNIGVGQAYALVRSGELPAIKVGAGGQWRIERSSLESYIDAKYEETRRSILWHQGEFANVTDAPFGERGSHTRTSTS
jgi:excisionase family DNA binding protein